jgi:steroid delta-isomerase
MKNQNLFLKRMLALATALMLLVVTSATRVEAAASYDLSPEQIEAAVEEYFASIGSLDVQRYVNNFAPDGVLEDPVGTPPIQGTQAIAAYFGAIITPFSEIKPYVQEVIVGGQEAIVNWKLKLKTTTGKVIIIDGMGVFKFNQQGKLQSVREFWDLAAFLAQLQS